MPLRATIHACIYLPLFKLFNVKYFRGISRSSPGSPLLQGSPDHYDTTTVVQKWEMDLVRVRVTLRLAVYLQSGRLGDKPLETHDQ
jgi:hypothetical protein